MPTQNKKNEFSRLILVTGVPGVGKTTIAQKLAQKLSLPIINFGDILFSQVKSKFKKVKQVDEMRTILTRDQYKYMQLSAAKKIVAIPGNKIVTSHLSIDTPIGFMPGFPRQIVEILHPDLIVIIESPTAEIKSRRQSEKSTRDRSHKLEMWIEFHQQYNRAMAASYSFYTGNYCFPIQNKQGEIDKSVAILTPVIKEIL